MKIRNLLKKSLLAVAIAGATVSTGAWAMGMNNAPCDSVSDCFYTAAWWVFWR